MAADQAGFDLKKNIFGLVALSLAGIVAISVVAYVAFGGDDGDAPAADPGTAFEGASPTPLPDTGVLDPNRPTEGEVVPDFALTDVRDPSVVRRLSDYRGTPVVLNWFASWCGPCKEEIPAFQQAQDDLGSDVVFLGVDYLESQERALGILNELGATFPALRDTNGEVYEHYRVIGMPTTFFIDADGVLVTSHSGGMDAEQLAGLLAQLGLEWVPDAGAGAGS